jgi:G3E family GTPase
MSDSTVSAPKPRFIMIGGFLGAGKTTAVGRLAGHLAGRGLRAGLITNDQGRNLADTALLRSQGFPTGEIPGGCFCCRFNSLVEAAAALARKDHPDVYIAEPVGSCTDLVATVSYPLRQLCKDRFTVAPVSVLVDSIRALRVFGLEDGQVFSEKVLYIYLKQIEEADLVVISKCDLIDEPRMNALQSAIAARFPRKEILCVSSRTGANLDHWFSRLTNGTQDAGEAMQVDYEVYAEGEALLGWLNWPVELAADLAFDADRFLTGLAEAMQRRLRSESAEIAHLKMTLDSTRQGGIAALNLVRNDARPELSRKLDHPVTAGQLIINLRAEASPDVLDKAVREALAECTRLFPTLRMDAGPMESFRPGKPSPTHRVERMTS